MEPAATLACRCGQVKLGWQRASKRVQAQCCCVDCYQKIDDLASKGGPPMHDKYVKKQVPISAFYVDNRFSVIQGQDQIRFSKLRAAAESTNMYASCCNTLLLVDCPPYKGNVVYVLDSGSMQIGFEDRPIDIRWWVKDWDQEALAKLPPEPSMWMWQRCVPVGNFSALMKVMSEFGQVVPEGMEGTTFQSLLKDAGGEAAIEVLNLTENPNAYKYREPPICSCGGF